MLWNLGKNSVVQLAATYDLRAGLFSDAPEEERELDIRLGVDLVSQSTNPVIKKIRSLIVDEMSPEEEELLRMGGGSVPAAQSEGDKFTLKRDDALLAVRLHLQLSSLRLPQNFHGKI